jgi:hypothetical protein
MADHFRTGFLTGFPKFHSQVQYGNQLQFCLALPISITSISQKRPCIPFDNFTHFPFLRHSDSFEFGIHAKCILMYLETHSKGRYPVQNLLTSFATTTDHSSMCNTIVKRWLGDSSNRHLENIYSTYGGHCQYIYTRSDKN